MGFLLLHHHFPGHHLTAEKLHEVHARRQVAHVDGGRALQVEITHDDALGVEDVDRYNRMMTSGTLAGFKIYVTNHGVQYSTSGAKQDYGTTNAQPCSIAFCKSEVMRAMGTIDGEPEKRWADYRGWLLGFQMRFVAMPFRSKGIGAIYSKNA